MSKNKYFLKKTVFRKPIEKDNVEYLRKENKDDSIAAVLFNKISYIYVKEFSKLRYLLIS